MTSDGTNTYAWDAEDRLVQITYPGSGNITQFSYDALSRATKIEERISSSVVSTRSHVWKGGYRCEERDGTGGLNDGIQFYRFGEVGFSTSVHRRPLQMSGMRTGKSMTWKHIRNALQNSKKAWNLCALGLTRKKKNSKNKVCANVENNTEHSKAGNINFTGRYFGEKELMNMSLKHRDESMDFRQKPFHKVYANTNPITNNILIFLSKYAIMIVCNYS